MDRRTKILAYLLAAGAAYALLSAVVYPEWLKPMFTIDKRVSDARAELDELLEFDAKVEDAKFTYRRYLDRIGTFDAKKLDPDVRERLNKLIAEHKLTDLTLSGGSARNVPAAKNVLLGNLLRSAPEGIPEPAPDHDLAPSPHPTVEAGGEVGGTHLKIWDAP